MRIIIKHRLARVSPWILAAACGLLALIITVFAVNNYRRDKALMTDILLEKGVTLIRFVVSSSRNSIFAGLRTGQDISTLWPGNVQRVLEHASEHPGVTFLALVNDKGVVLANSVPEEHTRQVSEQTRNFLASLDADSVDTRTFNFRINNEGKDTLFQVAAFFPPIGKRFLKQLDSASSHMHSQDERMNRMMRRHGPDSEWRKKIETLNKEKYVILVELDMTQFKERLQRQKLEIIILSIVLLLVGVGGWFSILTLEGLKGSQSRLRRVEAFRDILISSLPVGLIATDNSGGVILYNQFAQDLIGIDEKKVLEGGAGIFETMPDIRAAFDLPGKQQDELYQKEIQLSGEAGISHTVQLSRLAIIDSDKSFVGTLLMMQDLSQVKTLEKELRRSERLAALGKMAAGVAHELRNPLSSIKGLALVLQSKFSGENQDRGTADILVQEVERLNRSISELLDFARPQQLQKENVDLQQLLHKGVSLLCIDAEAAGVKMVTDFPEALPLVFADEDKLNQVFLNLFLNAIQAMESGGTLSITTTKAENSVKVIVKDTGCGIPAENLGRVFDPYFTTKPDGTGLGMAMSAKIVEEHGGTITLESSESQGCSVIVELPI